MVAYCWARRSSDVTPSSGCQNCCPYSTAPLRACPQGGGCRPNRLSDVLLLDFPRPPFQSGDELLHAADPFPPLTHRIEGFEVPCLEEAVGKRTLCRIAPFSHRAAEESGRFLVVCRLDINIVPTRKCRNSPTHPVCLGF